MRADQIDPAKAGTKVLIFKDEDEINGMPIGPVVEGTLNESGYPTGNPRPFDPNREPDPFFTLRQAQDMARARGLELYEV